MADSLAVKIDRLTREEITEAVNKATEQLKISRCNDSVTINGKEYNMYKALAFIDIVKDGTRVEPSVEPAFIRKILRELVTDRAANDTLIDFVTENKSNFETRVKHALVEKLKNYGLSEKLKFFYNKKITPTERRVPIKIAIHDVGYDPRIFSPEIKLCFGYGSTFDNGPRSRPNAELDDDDIILFPPIGVPMNFPPEYFGALNHICCTNTMFVFKRLSDIFDEDDIVRIIEEYNARFAAKPDHELLDQNTLCSEIIFTCVISHSVTEIRIVRSAIHPVSKGNNYVFASTKIGDGPINEWDFNSVGDICADNPEKNMHAVHEARKTARNPTPTPSLNTISQFFTKHKGDEAQCEGELVVDNIPGLKNQVCTFSNDHLVENRCKQFGVSCMIQDSIPSTTPPDGLSRCESTFWTPLRDYNQIYISICEIELDRCIKQNRHIKYILLKCLTMKIINITTSEYLSINAGSNIANYLNKLINLIDSLDLIVNKIHSALTVAVTSVADGADGADGAVIIPEEIIENIIRELGEILAGSGDLPDETADIIKNGIKDILQSTEKYKMAEIIKRIYRGVTVKNIIDLRRINCAIVSGTSEIIPNLFFHRGKPPFTIVIQKMGLDKKFVPDFYKQAQTGGKGHRSKTKKKSGISARKLTTKSIMRTDTINLRVLKEEPKMKIEREREKGIEKGIEREREREIKTERKFSQMVNYHITNEFKYFSDDIKKIHPEVSEDDISMWNRWCHPTKVQHIFYSFLDKIVIKKFQFGNVFNGAQDQLVYFVSECQKEKIEFSTMFRETNTINYMSYYKNMLNIMNIGEYWLLEHIKNVITKFIDDNKTLNKIQIENYSFLPFRPHGNSVIWKQNIINFLALHYYNDCLYKDTPYFGYKIIDFLFWNEGRLFIGEPNDEIFDTYGNLIEQNWRFTRTVFFNDDIIVWMNHRLPQWLAQSRVSLNLYSGGYNSKSVKNTKMNKKTRKNHFSLLGKRRTKTKTKITKMYTRKNKET
jgi:hypothetical protein